jgi:succinoglycan biosynthesis protein ExoA
MLVPSDLSGDSQQQAPTTPVPVTEGLGRFSSRPVYSGNDRLEGSWTPTVAVVIPALNEERHIRTCLASVFGQSYPADRLEVVVADGGSVDRTREIVTDVAVVHPNLRLVGNPRRNQAAGLNQGIAVTRAEVVARLDGHAAWRPDHLRRCVDLLASTGADNVGGRMEAIGDTTVAAAVALATGSRLAVGGARFHYARRQRDTDTVFLGCFRRTALERVGPFNESAPPHEDYEYNYRIRATGGRIVYSPEISTMYWTRSDWPTLAKQYFRYGRSKSRIARHNPGVIRPYHLVPPAFVLSVVPAGVGLAYSRGRVAIGALATLYAAICLGEGARLSRRAPASVRAQVPLVFPVLHVSWGAGFLLGLIQPATASIDPSG